MITQSPKHIIKNFRNRNVAIGNERRRNMVKTVLEHQPHFPKTLNYEDIDREVFNWLEKSFDLVYDGKKFNTYKLFSNQRMTEYGQTWQNLDDKGNLEINFKTITREPNPQKGDIYGGNYNIPGTITFPIFKLRTIDENGIEYTETYSMKQPFAVNLIYTIGIFTNTYKMLNKMNTDVHNEFKSLEKYIFPNGFAIPMELNSVSDESEYTIDDRKYYCQTFQIKVLAYIITENDYVVTKVPSRAKIQFISGRNSSLRQKKEKFDIQQLSLGKPEYTIENPETCEGKAKITNPSKVETIEEIMNTPVRQAELEIEELCGKQVCWEETEEEFYVNKKVLIIASLNYCQPVCEFVSDYHMGIESLELKNTKSYKILINGNEVKIEDSDVDILIGDNVRIEVSVFDEKEIAEVKMLCYDVDTIVEKQEETAIDTIQV